MAIKKYKPTSPARRAMTVSAFEEITTSTPERSLLEPLKKHAGTDYISFFTIALYGLPNITLPIPQELS